MTVEHFFTASFSVVLLALTMIICTTTNVVHADTLFLAECPAEPDVSGDYYNNGKKCIRDRKVLGRDTIPATCPEGMEFGTNGYCRDPTKKKRKNRKSKPLKPTCPENYQRFGKNCQKQCPESYKSKFGQCILSKDTLSTKYMACPDPSTQHRYDAYCCTPANGDCPAIECKLGDNVPGTFYYDADTSTCKRDAVSVARQTSKRRRPTGGANPPEPPCAPGLQLVWGVCQEPCPPSYRPMKGKCELRECTFDATTDKTVTCPEGIYAIPQALL